MLNELGGAWDLPPKADENFGDPRLDPLRMKARLLIEGFDSRDVWGWKDPRNSLTLPFWQNLLPGLKTLIMVRNPLEVAYSMRERNGTSYSFGLRLWEIYNRRLIEAATAQQQLVTHYDLFFEDAESELRRIAHFIGLPDAEVANAAALVRRQKRHARFSIDNLIDARVSGEVIQFYRALISEAKGKTRSTSRGAKQGEPDLPAGAITRLNAAVPETIAQIQHLERELLAQAEARHKREVAQTAPTFKKSAATLSRRMSYFAIGVLVWRRAKRRETSYEIVCGSNCKLPRSLPGCWTSLKTQQPDFALRHAGKLQIRLPPSRQNFLPRSRGGC
ncbi:MAG: hypothetical protein DME84_09125 [Verrucomicrobia bacterium]|nr:MAG: hypothetical protein DME84_09125 [Verrucomicrobiota bacterium]